MTNVHIVGGDYLIEQMFRHRGWNISSLSEDVDLIQFTGGSDVDPSYYGEEKHATTGSNPKRDAHEAHIYHQFVGKVPLTGICRGGQFLNVMSGGKMWQNVDNHAIGGTHQAFFPHPFELVYVTSTHHQMMREGNEGIVLGYAAKSSFRESATERNEDMNWPDVECVLYGQTLCFQPHPEYVDQHHECQELYFYLLEHYLGVK